MKGTGQAARRGLFASAALMAIAMMTTPAMAQQEAAAEDDTGPADIVVTAQMRSQNIQDIPLAITAVSGELLESRSQTRLTDITAQAPNVLMQQNPAGSGNSMRAYIRGIGQADQSPSVEPGVGIYVDDIYFGTVTASAFDLVDLDRVEVLRGPQGTLAGMNSEGGAIKLYSRKPEGDGGYVEATLGNLGRRDFKASADFTVVPDAVFARVTGVTRNRDGHVSLYNYACVNPTDPDVVAGRIPKLTANGNCKTGELGNQAMYAIRGFLRIAPQGSPLEINLIGDYTKDTSNTQASTLIASAESATKGAAAGYVNRSGISVPYQGVAYDDRFVPYGQYRRSNAVLNDPYASYANFFDPGVTYRATGPGGGTAVPVGASNGPYIAANASQVEGWGLSGTIDYELSPNLSIKSITGYRKYDTLSGNDNDNSPVVFIQSTDWFSHRQFSQELRLAGNFVDDTVHFTIGGIYYDAKTHALSRIHTPFSGFGPPDKPSFSFLNDDTATMKVKAGFANAAWDITEALTLEGGIRVTDQKKDYTFGRYNPDGVGDYLPLSNPTNPLSGYVGTYKATVTDYRAAASYKITQETMVYAQFATGHKAGGIAPRPYDYRQIRPFGAEKLKSYELGFKTDLLDRKLRLNGSAFYMNYEGYQGIPTVCVGLDNQPLPANAGGTPNLCGQYLNLADAKVKGFELETTIRPVDGMTIDGSLSYVDFKFGKPNFQTNDVREGSRRPGIGDWKWSIGAQYKFDAGEVGTLTPRVDVSYMPDYCGNFACDPNVKVQSFTLVNARLTFRTVDEDWQVSLEATNLFDKFYYVNKFANAFYTTGQPGRPREVAVTVRRNF
jgi:iron complex outermembrane receptor protein